MKFWLMVATALLIPIFGYPADIKGNPEITMRNQYVLVLEFRGNGLATYDRVVAIETRLEAVLKTGKVDGHDEGRGVMNIFIKTRNPKECFKESMVIMKGLKEVPDAAGYRKLVEEQYERLWPKGNKTRFEIK